jgi:oligo-alginate lyase
VLRWFAFAAALAATYDVGPFPKDHPERAFAELKVRDSSGSPLRRPRENWQAARRQLSGDPQWAAWLKTRRAELDDWMEHRRDRVDWVAGWWHDFVSPKDGGFLTWTPDEPGPATLSSPSDPRVELTPKLHGGWVFGFRSRHTDKVLEAARMWRSTGDRKYAAWAAAQLDFYAENWAKWPIQTAKSKSRLMHQSLDDANVLIRLVNAARLLDASKEQRERWIAKLFRPQAELLDDTFQRIHNIACWQRSAMAQTAIYAGDDELWRRAVDGPFGIRKQLEHGVTGEYLWFEQSFGYNSYVVSALLPLFTMASLEGRAAELAPEMHAAENMMLAPIYLRFATGQLPNPADATGGLPFAPNVRTLASAYRVFPTALGLAEAAKERNWDTLLDPPEPASPGPLPAVQARDWTSSRMAVLRSGDWQVFVHYGQLHQSHAQSEALNFEAFYGTTDVTHDAGTVGYGSPLHTGFYRTGLAHNVPLVNREGQVRWNVGELVRFAPDAILVRQPKYRPDAEASRDLRIDGRKLIDATTIRLTSPGATLQRLGLVLHLQGKITPPEGRKTDPIELPVWTNIRTVDLDGPTSFLVQLKDRAARVTISATGPLKLTVGETPDAPPARRESIYLETMGTSATFTTTIEIAGR